MSAAAVKVPAVFMAIDRVSAPVRNMANSVQGFAARAQGAITTANASFNKLIPTFGQIGQQLFAFSAATAFTLGIYSAVNAVKDYETALASLSAITGVTGKAFIPFQAQVSAVATATQKSGIEVAKAFEIVGSAKAELLQNADALGAVTQAAITLSKASRDDLAASAANLTGVMNQFSLGAEQANRVINVLAAGSQVGAANITQINEAMVNFGAVAAGSNISVEQAVALVETLGEKSLFGAEAGTKLRGAVLKLQQAGVGYASGQFNINDALSEAQKRLAKLTTAKQKDAAILKMFGAENITTGKILLDNVETFNRFTQGVTNTNVAQQQAAINSNTLAERLSQLQAAWVNMLTGNTQANTGLNAAKNLIAFVTNNLSTLVTVLGAAIALLTAYKVGLVLSSAALTAYNIVLGVTNALNTQSLVLTSSNTVAQKAYIVTTKLMAGALLLWEKAQWLVNVALTANPIGVIVMGIAAAIVAVIAIIKYWNQWGAAIAAIAAFFSPAIASIMFLISMVQSLIRNWDMVKAAFKAEGIIGGLKAIGKVILDAILMPVQQLMEKLSALPKWLGGGMAQKAAQNLANTRAQLGVNTTTGTGTVPQPANPRKAEQDALISRTETTTNNNQRVELDFKNVPPGLTVNGQNASSIIPKTNPTIGF